MVQKKEQIKQRKQKAVKEAVARFREEFLSKPAKELIFESSNGHKWYLVRQFIKRNKYLENTEKTYLYISLDDENHYYRDNEHWYIANSKIRIKKKELTKQLSEHYQFTPQDCEDFIPKFREALETIEKENGKDV